MSLHITEQLVAAIVSALRGRTTAGQNVIGEPSWPTDAGSSSFPIVFVFDAGGSSSFAAMADDDASRPLDRVEDIVVELRAQGVGGEGPGLRQACAALAAEIEPLMMGDAGIGALVDERQLVETVKDYGLAGDGRLGAWRLRYRMLFTTPAGDPTAKV